MSNDNNDHVFLGTNYEQEEPAWTVRVTESKLNEIEDQAYNRGLMDGWDAACD